MKFSATTKQHLLSAALLVSFFIVWELSCIIFDVSDFVLPRPSQIFVVLAERMTALLPHAWQTLSETLVGFALGVFLGVVIGTLIGSSKTAYGVVYPLMIGFSSIPKVAIVPIFVLWFGPGYIPAVLTAVILCVFPVMVNVAAGLATTEPELEDVLAALGASRLEVLWNVGLPRTLPYFFASLKIAITVSFVGTVLSESIAANKGLGNAILIAASTFNVPLVFACLFLLAFMGICLYAIFAAIEQRLCGWAYRRDDFAMA